MDANSEVLFKEKREEKGIKFVIRASTPAMPPPGRGTKVRGGNGEEQRRVELKKFSLRPKKYDGKGNLLGWVNQFEEYAILGQWNEGHKCISLVCRSGRTWYTPPGSRLSVASSDSRRTPALRYRSWLGLGTGR